MNIDFDFDTLTLDLGVGFIFDEVTLILLAISFCCLFLLVTVYRHFITTVYRKSVKDNYTQDEPIEETLPPVSVVVYATPDCQGLADTLNAILEQDYPAEFDVTVVNDGQSDDVKDIVNLIHNTHKNLFITFVPDDAHSLSRRKLSMTLGIKGARHDCVVFTNAGVQIESNRWLELMVRPYAAGKEVVIGYCALDHYSPLSSMQAFDRVATSAAYLGSAINGAPYRANNNNLVISKKTFFANNGFSRSLNLHGGDDDIFISEICNKHNTAVVLASEAILYFSPNNPGKFHRHDKKSHIFTGRRIFKSGNLMMSFGSWMRFIGLGSGIAAAIWGLPSLIPAIWVAITFVSTATIMSVAWNKTALAIGEQLGSFGIIFTAIFRPLYNFYYGIVSLRTSRQNYTWS
ncbi:MAG: glycosyltransferase [Muribaculaceae bacterium]|nr:glycosyltransferase [Muribaculaceae bacterium]